jgi:hypothetical protein
MSLTDESGSIYLVVPAFKHRREYDNVSLYDLGLISRKCMAEVRRFHKEATPESPMNGNAFVDKARTVTVRQFALSYLVARSEHYINIQAQSKTHQELVDVAIPQPDYHPTLGCEHALDAQCAECARKTEITRRYFETHSVGANSHRAASMRRKRCNKK